VTRACAAYIGGMASDSSVLYKALTARDARFDGTFFVGVTSTGIYCRPVCPAKTPKLRNCRFFASPQQAEQEHFRPCLRCRPELAPGNAPIDDAQRIAQLVVQRLEDDSFGDDTSIETIAAQFHLSSRQIRRIVRTELGVPPIQLILTRRLLLAKQLLTETRLPVTDVAYASGFSSLRRFNDAFRSRYGFAPSALRKQARESGAAAGEATTSTLLLSYRPPYDWSGVLAFLRGRALTEVEWVTDDFYARTVRIGDRLGSIRVSAGARNNTLAMEFTHTLTPVLPAVLRRVRDLLDLDARPDLIAKQLRKDERLAPLVKRAPGLRVPGAFHGFEMGVRAIIGQQVTVKAATTLARRFVTRFGEPYATPFPELARLTPTPERVAAATVDEIASLGIVGARARSIIALAEAHVSGALSLEHRVHHSPTEIIVRLAELPGIGAWTAHYIAMRALRWPDAFPKEDIAVRNRLGGVSAKQAELLSQPWRPWRSYAVLHLWRASAAAPPASSAAPPARDTRKSAARRS
jgi:AraC family transcriptional regulator, regulatory protein of adaptative response / DNA-3-methyladenine glycosylase II